MLFFGRKINQDIIKENYDTLMKEGSKDIVHEGHEGSGCIGQTEGHDREFELS